MIWNTGCTLIRLRQSMYRRDLLLKDFSILALFFSAIQIELFFGFTCSSRLRAIAAVKRYSVGVGLLLFIFAAPVTCRSQELSRAAVAAIAKASTVLIDVGGQGSGSGFCIDPSGLIITNEHVVRGYGQGGILTVVVDAGLKTERVIPAKVVRRDKVRDLALLSVESNPAIPSLSLGTDESVSELSELIVLGFPFGNALAKPGTNPSVTANVVNVSALRRDENNAIDRIQLDSNLNPGNSGGPVMNREGRIVGVVISGIVGAGINLAIPVNRLRQFLERPILVFTPPTVEVDQQTLPAEFRVTASQLTGEPLELELELILRLAGSAESRLPMKKEGSVYQVKAVPFPDATPPGIIRTQLQFADSLLTTAVVDREVRVGDNTFKLSEIAWIKNSHRMEVALPSGERFRGPVESSGSLKAKLAGKWIELDLPSVKELNVLPEIAIPLNCKIIAIKKGGDKDEVGSIQYKLYHEGAPRGNLDAIKMEKYLKPLDSAEPNTYLNAVSAPGEVLGGGASLNFGGDLLRMTGDDRVIRVNIGQNLNLTFAAPNQERLKVGEYRRVMRYPNNEDLPGLSIEVNGRGGIQPIGSFVIWELEIKEKNVVRLAVDFVHRCEPAGQPFYGMLRFNSLMR